MLKSDDRLDGGEHYLSGYAHVANYLRGQVEYRSLAVLVSGWEDGNPRVAYRTSVEEPPPGSGWTADELHTLVQDSPADSSVPATVIERAKATWVVSPIGELHPPAAYLLIEREPGRAFTDAELSSTRAAAMEMTAPVVEAELHSAREQLKLERKMNLDMSERIVEASESRGWQESAHQELQRAFDTLTAQKLELEEAYRWSTVAHQEIQKAFDELKVANGAKTRFLATVSHELKTPLTSISAFTDILKKNRSGNLEARELKQLDVVSRNVHRLNLLINDLLDLTRIDAGTLMLELDDFRISDLLRDMSAMFEPILNRRNQNLEVEDGSSGLWLSGDRDRLEQMITNLVTNASKFSPEGTAISLGANIIGDTLELTVRDCGVGIPDNSVGQIFDAFYRVDNEATRGVPGTGVGLYITASIVKLHDGEIGVESAYGRGTTFRALLPRVLEGPSEEHIRREASRLQALDQHRSRLEKEHREAA